MRDEWDLFATDNTVVLPISVDSTATLKEYKEKHALQPDFLSDFRRVVSRLYDVLIEMRYYSNRAYFLIDKAGIIQWAHVEAHPGQKRTNAELLQHIQALA